jgi:hypothetical protein
MVAILLSAGPFKMHYVCGLGWRGVLG